MKIAFRDSRTGSQHFLKEKCFKSTNSHLDKEIKFGPTKK